ncbi:MAG: ATP-binding protein [Armatimonadota bacterium]
MKLFAATVVEHILRQVQKAPSGAAVQVMVPSLPAGVVAQMGEMLETNHLRGQELSTLLFRVARELVDHWRQSSEAPEREAEERIQRCGWSDYQGSLTALRNELSGLTVLVGVDRVTDRGSLEDFHQCGPEVVWREELQGSFAPWIRTLLEDAHIAYDDSTCPQFDQVLEPLVERGLADYVQVSYLLESLALGDCQDGRDALALLLRSLAPLKLPCFIGFRFGGRASFGPYLTDAVAFYSYDSLLEPARRKKAAEAIKRFLKEKEERQLPPEEWFEPAIRGDFPDNRSFVEAVAQYVETNESAVQQQLLHCDYVTIRDQILGFKPTSNGEPKPQKETVKKVSGGPIEAVLTALWAALSDYTSRAADEGVGAHEGVSSIDIRATRFKHDCTGADSETNGSARERTPAAQEALARLLGGVEQWLQESLDLGALRGDEAELFASVAITGEHVQCVSAGNGEPRLEFDITISGEGLRQPSKSLFAWRLPPTHPYRMADEMFQWAARALRACTDCAVPAFGIPYYQELMLAKDSEETVRVLGQGLQSEQCRLVDLLALSNLGEHDPLYHQLRDLARSYAGFALAAADEGLYWALWHEFAPLRNAYDQLVTCYLHDERCRSSEAGALLFRAFLLIEARDPQDREWVWQDYEPSAAVTVLHPALLEMLQAQAQYLLTGFLQMARRELHANGSQSFRSGPWERYLDLAALQTPLCGLLKDAGHGLDTQVRGEGLVHRLGRTAQTEATLSTRLLLRYEAFEDEDIPDKELFRESREALLIRQVLNEYRALHPHAEDGLSLAVYQEQDVQPLIAALDGYLEDVYKQREVSARPYTLSVTVFSEAGDDSSVARWLGDWRARWEAAENKSTLKHYRDVELIAAHRLVAAGSPEANFVPLLSGLEVDVAILNGFIGSSVEDSHFEPVPEYDVRQRILKFPVLEKPCCASQAGGHRWLRERVLSNRQFVVGRQFTGLMARLRQRRQEPQVHYVALGSGDFLPWKPVVDELHRRAEWVVCIDPSMDERLLENRPDADGNAPVGRVRDVIGFGSGVGSHGEANFTVSTEEFRLSDILRRLEPAIQELYGGWEAATSQIVATSVLREAQKLSGLSVVRATGAGQQIRDFVAYALTRKLLVPTGEVLCDQLVSLDAYRHWFEASDKRPDLLWVLVTRGEDNRLRLDLRLLECKLAIQPEQYLPKALLQIEAGLEHLVKVFLPAREGREGNDDARPDQRYWWLQLQRLIASRTSVVRHEREVVLAALERLSDGEYDVCWGAAALCFCTDAPGDGLSIQEERHFPVLGSDIPVSVVSIARDTVPKLCQPGHGLSLNWQAPACFSGSARLQEALEADTQSQCADAESATAEEAAAATALVQAPLPAEPQHQPQQTVTDVVTAAAAAASPQRVFLGVSTRGDRQVYWEFGHQDLSNRHLLVFGASGMGKTYAIQCLLQELAQAGQNSLIIDYTDGFREERLAPEFAAAVSPVQHNARNQPLQINPFRRQIDPSEGNGEPERAMDTALRVAGVFDAVYNIGDQQKSALYQAVLNGVEALDPAPMVMGNLLEYLEALREEGGVLGHSAGSAISKIRPFVDQRPFGQEDPASWEHLLTDVVRRCHVLQLTGFPRDASRLITEFALIDLYWFYRACGREVWPRVLVLDEVQNLDHNEDGALSNLLREGRKFGLSLILATQNLTNLPRDAKDRLFNAGHKLFFRPADTEIRSYAEIIAAATGERVDNWTGNLARLSKGKCYSLGPSLNTATGALEIKAFEVQITSLSERSSHA